MPARLYTVFTGDLVRSSDLSATELAEARREVKAAAGRLSRLSAKLVRGEPDFFRGDAWQMLVTDPRFALHAALYIRAGLIAGGVGDTRIAMGFGTIKRANTQRVSLSTGDAFSRSGAALDQMPRRARMTAALPGEPGGWVGAVVRLCDVLVGQWTARQAEVVGWALLNPDATQEQLATMSDEQASRQAVAKALAGAGWDGVRAALVQFESCHWKSPT